MYPPQVQYAAEIKLTIVNEDGDVFEGGEAKFACTANANPGDVVYKWFINNELVVGDYTTEMVSTKCVLLMLRVQIASLAIYMRELTMMSFFCSELLCRFLCFVVMRLFFITYMRSFLVLISFQ